MNDRELEELLRSRPEPLRPPAGKWETVRRRARRRRVAKLSGALLATAVVVGGGLTPFVLRSHNRTADEQRLTVAGVPSVRRSVPFAPAHETPVPLPAAVSMRGFHPQSVSFVSQDNGFLLGSGTGGRAAVATTADGGGSWSHLATLAVAARGASVRFATPTTGFVFGSMYSVTTDGGRSWSAQPSPGYISDLETMNGHVYALVTACAGCDPATVYAASIDEPTLRRVPAIPAAVGDSVSLAVSGNSASILASPTGRQAGPGEVWTTLDGTRWFTRPSPCTGSGIIAQWSGTGLAVVCRGPIRPAAEKKSVYVSTDAGQHWTALPAPSSNGAVASISASDAHHVVLGDLRTGMDVTTDGGRHWARRGPAMVNGASFVGFISATRVVALPAGASDRFFTTSYDSGRTWATTRFPK